MENQINRDEQRKFIKGTIMRNEVMLEKLTKSRQKLKFRTDMMFSRLDFLIEVAGNMKKGNMNTKLL